MQDAAEAAWAAGTPEAARFDVDQFRRWYHQAGTPVLQIHRHWDGERGELELVIRQHTPPTPGQPDKQPLVIPLALGLIDQAGEPLTVRLQGEDEATAAAAQRPLSWGQGTRLLVVEAEEQRLRLVGLPRQAHPPALSLLRQFSAPLKLEIGRPSSELVHLLAHDSEAFARWDAGQGLAAPGRARPGRWPAGWGSGGCPDHGLCPHPARPAAFGGQPRHAAGPAGAGGARGWPRRAGLPGPVCGPGGPEGPVRGGPGGAPAGSPGALHTAVESGLAGRQRCPDAHRHDLELACCGRGCGGDRRGPGGRGWPLR